MPIMIKVAKSNAELNDTLNFRYKCLEESGHKINIIFQRSTKISDYFDVYPSTINIMAYESGRVIANLRCVEYAVSEECLNHVYDFRSSFENLKSPAYIIDLEIVDPNYSVSKILKSQMYKTLFLNLHKQGIKYCFSFLVKSEEDFLNQFSYQKISNDQFFFDDRELSPVIINIDDFNTKFESTVVDKEILKFNDVFYQAIFYPGEVLVLEGEKGSCAFLIDQGQLEILIRKDGAVLPVGKVGAGQLVGEVAMTTGEKRTASIMATELTSCLAFDRSSFMKLMYEQPSKALEIFKILSKRLAQANRSLAALRKG